MLDILFLWSKLCLFLYELSDKMTSASFDDDTVPDILILAVFFDIVSKGDVAEQTAHNVF